MTSIWFRPGTIHQTYVTKRSQIGTSRNRFVTAWNAIFHPDLGNVMATGFATVFSGRSATESELFVSTEERQRYWSCWSSTLHRSFYCLVPSQCKIPQIHPFYILTKKSRFSNNRLRQCRDISGGQVAMIPRGTPARVYWNNMRAQLAEQGRFVSFCGCNQSWSTFFRE